DVALRGDVLEGIEQLAARLRVNAVERLTSLDRSAELHVQIDACGGCLRRAGQLRDARQAPVVDRSHDTRYRCGHDVSFGSCCGRAQTALCGGDRLEFSPGATVRKRRLRERRAAVGRS